jgi:putative SbcD/Mre11-related phosphoesterase
MRITSDLYLLVGYPALYVKSVRAVVISDLHLGFESAVSSEGIYLPRVQLKKAIDLVTNLSKITNAEKLIINGDLKHVFEKLTLQEREESTKLLSVAKDYFKEIVLVRGNHDNYISVVTSRFDIPILEKLELNPETVALHGHIYEEEALRYKYIVIGHEHPSLRIPDELGGVLRFPCFLVTPLRNSSTAIVLPAAGHYQTGNPVTLDENQYLSPLIKKQGIIGESVPYVVEYGKITLEFPRLSKLMLIS